MPLLSLFGAGLILMQWSMQQLPQLPDAAGSSFERLKTLRDRGVVSRKSPAWPGRDRGGPLQWEDTRDPRGSCGISTGCGFLIVPPRETTRTPPRSAGSFSRLAAAVAASVVGNRNARSFRDSVRNYVIPAPSLKEDQGLPCTPGDSKCGTRTTESDSTPTINLPSYCPFYFLACERQ